MDNFYLKSSSGGGAQTYPAPYIEKFYETEETNYTDTAWEKQKVVHAKWIGYSVIFGILTEAQMDWLAELITYAVPQFSLNGSTYYDMKVKSVSPKVEGGTIVVVKKDAE